jgi:DNA-binding response OmpR family regulator
MKRILVIEDSAEFRGYIAEILSLSGFGFIEASNAAQAIQLAHDERPDLIVCDLHLTDEDGFAAIQAIRHNEGEIPFVMLSADGGESQVQRGLELGAEAYMVKPVPINDFIRVIRENLPAAA